MFFSNGNNKPKVTKTKRIKGKESIEYFKASMLKTPRLAKRASG